MRRRDSLFAIAVGGLWGRMAAAAAPDEPAAPAVLALPPGYRPVLRATGRGVQIYKAAAGPGGKLGWILEAPLAGLTDDRGEPAGLHYEGPTWEAPDGSAAVRDEAEPVRSAPAPDPRRDIPWLLVKVKPGAGAAGTLSRVAYIQRLQTAGGKEPEAPPLRAGSKVGVPYTALYVLSARAD